MTQSELVFNYIKDFGSITALNAFADLGVTRLSATIYILRKRGIPITSEREASVNRYGKTVHYARYKFAEVGNE